MKIFSLIKIESGFYYLQLFGKGYFFTIPAFLTCLYRDLKYRFQFRDGGFCVTFHYTSDSWRIIKIGGKAQELININSGYDCTGEVFCHIVDKYFFGIVTIGYYGVDI